MAPLKVLDCDASFRPDDVAFVQNDDIWTYKRFTEEINRLARGLLAHGCREGDRVALHMRNLPELAVAYFACFRIGAIAAPLNTRLKAPEIEQHLERLRPVLYIGQDELYYGAVAGVGESALPRQSRYVVGSIPKADPVNHWTDLMAGSSERLEFPEPSFDVPAVLLSTSGTTGLSKYVTHSLATISAACELFAENALSRDDVALITTPMVHASGFFFFIASLWQGAPVVLLERFDADTVVDAIEQYRVTWFAGLPFMLTEMFQSQLKTVRDVTSLKTCLVSGDVCAPRIQEQFKVHFGTPLLSLWAATEVVGSIKCGSKSGPVSRVAADAEIRLCDRYGMPVAHGEPGELQIRGPNVTLGYWEAPDVVREATQNGWYRTGDLMRRDEKGELWFVSRIKDIIIRGGSNISPAEVERALASHPAVKDVGVVGVPDDLFGERVIGFIQLSPSAGNTRISDILANARRIIADYKLPERIEVVSQIPRNSLGKIDRRALQEAFLSHQDAVA